MAASHNGVVAHVVEHAAAADLHATVAEGRATMREPLPWRISSSRPRRAPSWTAAEPVASSSAMPIATGKTRTRTTPASSSMKAHATTMSSSPVGAASASTSAAEPS